MNPLLGLNMSDYQSNALNNQVMFGQAGTTEEQLSDLTKALEAGQVSGLQTLNDPNASGSPLKTESLDRTLKLITFRESEIVLWKKVPKLPAYNTVEEFNQLQSYGADRGGFIREGELPVEEDSVYVRRSQLVKFLGVTKSVTHPMAIVNTVLPSVIDREAKNGALWVLRKLDRAMTKGNANLVPDEFNGLYAQHEQNDEFATKDQYFGSDSVVDLRGAPMTEAPIENAAEGIIENHGYGNELFAPPSVLSDFAKSFYGNKFIVPNTESVSNGIMGQRVNYFDSQFGRIGLNYDIFLNKEANKTLATAATSVNAPSQVTGGSVTPVGAPVASSLWGAGDAGDYFYAVSAVNRFGESALTLLDASAATIVAEGAVDLSWVAGVGANPATAYTVFRSTKDAASSATAKFFPLYSISTAELAQGNDGAAPGSARDLNRYLPDTNQAFLIQNDDEVYAFRQLAPLMKMDLAIISTAYRFMVLLYGTPLLFAPRKMTRFINVGKA